MRMKKFRGQDIAGIKIIRFQTLFFEEFFQNSPYKFCVNNGDLCCPENDQKIHVIEKFQVFLFYV